MISHQQAVRIADQILQSGGATFNNKGSILYLEGYQVGFQSGGWVAYQSSAPQYGMLQWVAENVLDFAECHKDWLDEGKDLGAWIHEGKLYLDLSKHYQDLEEAKLIGELEDQRAIFDWRVMGDISLVGVTA